ncbi:glycosyltransferase family 2 protein [Patescibacteria group bacterium]|nr:MAG: glycosyltransferase family 2 protein [Patescibacteria group bacterium]
MKASVVIPNWNGEEHLTECLNALKKQTFTDFETIVVDNGSTDGSVALIENKFPNVVLVRLPKNIGFAGGVNSGIKIARGEYISLLNNDAIAEPTWLEELIDAMKHADMAAAKILHYDDHTLVDSTGDFVSKWGLSYPRQRDQKDDVEYTGYPEIFAASGGANICKREVYDAIGLLDEDFFAYSEDVDFGFRARLAGFKIVLAPKARVYHHIGATSGKLGHFARRQSLKNTNYLYLKNMPSPLFWKLLPRFMFVQTLLFLAAIKAGAITVALSAYGECLLKLPKTLAKRRQIQSKRKLTSRQVEDLLTDHWPLRTRLVSPLAKKL